MLYFSYKSQPINMSVYACINMGYTGLVEAMEWVWLRALVKWHGTGAVTVNGCCMTHIYRDGEKPYTGILSFTSLLYGMVSHLYISHWPHHQLPISTTTYPVSWRVSHLYHYYIFCWLEGELPIPTITYSIS